MVVPVAQCNVTYIPFTNFISLLQVPAWLKKNNHSLLNFVWYICFCNSFWYTAMLASYMLTLGRYGCFYPWCLEELLKTKVIDVHRLVNASSNAPTSLLDKGLNCKFLQLWRPFFFFFFFFLSFLVPSEASWQAMINVKNVCSEKRSFELDWEEIISESASTSVRDQSQWIQGAIR